MVSTCAGLGLATRVVCRLLGWPGLPTAFGRTFGATIVLATVLAATAGLTEEADKGGEEAEGEDEVSSCSVPAGRWP